MERIDFKLYLITDRKQTQGRPLLDALKKAVDGGVRCIQLREKDLPVREYLKLSEAVRKITRDSGCKLIINDRIDIALAVEADGIHIGRSSLPVNIVRGLVGEKMLIGVSTHSLEEARMAEKMVADFITAGPIFYTPSKATYGNPLGIGMLSEISRKLSIPVFAIGGIKKENIREVLEAGAWGVATISAILCAENIYDRVKEISEEIGQQLCQLKS